MALIMLSITGRRWIIGLKGSMSIVSNGLYNLILQYTVHTYVQVYVSCFSNAAHQQVGGAEITQHRALSRRL